MNYAVIMAGGSGKRLWPLSRKNQPKQIIDVFGGESLLRHCVDRVKGIFDTDNILIVTNIDCADAIRNHLPELPPENTLGEPQGRNTAAAIGLAATVLNQKDPNAVMAVFSADQIIKPTEPLHQAVKKALRFLKSYPQALFTFGIKATFAHTGFGYLKRGKPIKGIDDDIYPVTDFREKPNKNTASKYIRSGNYCWNSGMFVWRADTILQRLDEFLPQNAAAFKRMASVWNTQQWHHVLSKEFDQLQNISIDFGVMERAAEVYMCELDCHWIDVGSYEALAETIGVLDKEGNITTPSTLGKWLDSKNNIIISDSKEHLIAGIHVENMIIAHTQEATLICHREEADRLKELLELIQTDGLTKFL